MWPNVDVIGGFIPSSFVSRRATRARTIVFLALGGYEGAPLASAAYLGWAFLAVLAVGLVAFWRDRRLWFFGFLFVLSRAVLARASGAGSGCRPGSSTRSRCSRT